MTDISNEIAHVAPKDGFAAADYNMVAKSARLKQVTLLSANFTVDPDLLSDQQMWKLSYGRSILSCQFSEEDNHVVAIFRYHVTAKSGRKKALHCVADYGVYYDTQSGATAAAAIGFCKNVGIFAAYPYFRALFANFVNEAGIRLPPLPTIASTAHIPPKTKSE